MFGRNLVYGVSVVILVQVAFGVGVTPEEIGEYQEIYITEDQIKPVAKQILVEHEGEIDQGAIFIENVSKEILDSGAEVCTIIKACEKRFVSWSDGDMVAGRSYGFMNPYINVAFLIKNQPCQKK